MIRLWAEGGGTTGMSELVAYQEGVKHPFSANVMRCEFVLSELEKFWVVFLHLQD